MLEQASHYYPATIIRVASSGCGLGSGSADSFSWRTSRDRVGCPIRSRAVSVVFPLRLDYDSFSLLTSGFERPTSDFARRLRHICTAPICTAMAYKAGMCVFFDPDVCSDSNGTDSGRSRLEPSLADTGTPRNLATQERRSIPRPSRSRKLRNRSLARTAKVELFIFVELVHCTNQYQSISRPITETFWNDVRGSATADVIK